MRNIFVLNSSTLTNLFLILKSVNQIIKFDDYTTNYKIRQLNLKQYYTTKWLQNKVLYTVLHASRLQPSYYT